METLISKESEVKENHETAEVSRLTPKFIVVLNRFKSVLSKWANPW